MEIFDNKRLFVFLFDWPRPFWVVLCWVNFFSLVIYSRCREQPKLCGVWTRAVAALLGVPQILTRTRLFMCVHVWLEALPPYRPVVARLSQ